MRRWSLPLVVVLGLVLVIGCMDDGPLAPDTDDAALTAPDGNVDFAKKKVARYAYVDNNLPGKGIGECPATFDRVWVDSGDAVDRNGDNYICTKRVPPILKKKTVAP